uniref:Prothymosin alpha n=2 Tax=Angiostrongylus cantonensis TaxID=6313 RepID=A0A0K0DM81_ANGCA
MSGSDVDGKEISAEKNEPVTAETAAGDAAEESRDSAASLDNDEKSYSGSEEKNGESEDGGEDEEGGDDDDEGADGDEENGKEGENGHVNSTDTNGNDRKRMSDAGGDEEARSGGAPALKKKKADDEEVGAGDVQAESVTAE